MTCSVDGCGKQRQCRGLCPMHYQRWRIHGDVHHGENKPTTCAVEDCDRPIESREWCSPHYQSWKRHGDPLAAKSRRRTPTPCSVDGCTDLAKARDMCPVHYASWRAHGDPQRARRLPRQTSAVCSVEGCEEPSKSQSLCKAHYQRYRRRGDPLLGHRVSPRGDDVARFWWYVSKDPGDDACWVWEGTVTESRRPGAKRHIYGVMQVVRPDGRSTGVRAHVFSYRLHVGPVPEGLQIDHLCRNTLCVRPDHLEAVTNKVNTDRGECAEVNRARWLARTHCKQGHPFAGDNLVITKRQRICRTCRNRKQREYTARRRVAA